MRTFYFQCVREQRKYFSVEAETQVEAESKANILVGQLDFTAKDDESDDPGELSLLENEE
jgi:hypothetical protein